MNIQSFVGGHEVTIYENCTYDPTKRKYTGGNIRTVIPYSGTMLNAKVVQEASEPILMNGYEIPVMSPQVFVDVDPIPDPSVCDYCVVSAMYVAACKSLGIDTSRLLTIGSPVVDDKGRTIGTTTLNRN